MTSRLIQVWNDDDGVLSFEWILLVTLLVIGIVGGVSAARDAIIDELGDVAQAMVTIDDSYSIDDPLLISIDGIDFLGGTSSRFTDAFVYSDCDRGSGINSSDSAAEFNDDES